MSGFNTNGLPLATVANGVFPFDGTETIPVDVNGANGVPPETVSVPFSQILGIGTPTNTAYAATVVISGVNGQVQTIGTLTGNISISFTNLVPGLTYRLRITQDATGSRTTTITGTVLEAGTNTTTASYVNWFSYWYDGTTVYGTWTSNFA